LTKLLGYNYKVEYKKGKENKAAYALFRMPQHVNVLAISAAVPLWVTEVLGSYKGDTKCQEWEEQLRVTPSAIPHLTISNGLIRHKGKIMVGKTTDLRARLLESFHNSVLGGHSGEKVTYTKLKSLFYWPGMNLMLLLISKPAQPASSTNLRTYHTQDYSRHYPYQIWLSNTSPWNSLKLYPNLLAETLY
jgi:hypothetical protein